MQNTHLQHPEDSILMGDLSVLDWFTEPGHVSVKIDGCPAIVWGTDPQTKTFFVGTKAVFNKKKLRIAHSHDEIDLHYEGEVRDILHACFDCLPRTDSIIQGDFIGFGGDDTYKPNVITYVFPDLVTQSIILAPHTLYEANDDLRDSWSIPLVAQLKSTRDVLFVQPEGWQDDDKFDDIVRFVRQMSTTVEFAKTKTKARKIEKVLNTFIKIGAVLDPEALADVADCDLNLMRLWKLVKVIKEDRLSLCATSGGPGAYLGRRFIGSEGYVLSNEYGSYKLVKRETFSRYNFNNSRFSVPVQ
jgi:hypothetical protein